MPTLLTHISVRPDAIERWEEILAVLARRTHGEEQDCLRYEYWRGEELGRYYALLAYRTTEAFFAHQASDYHDAYLDDFATMFTEMRLEWVDPVQADGAPLPRTANEPLPPSAPAKLHDQTGFYPILIADWWQMAREAEGKTTA